MINIVLADDHALMRVGLTDLLNRHGYQVIAQAQNFTELKSILAQQQVDIIICDCKMPGDGPVNFMYYLQKNHFEHKVIFLSALDSGLLFSQLLNFGAQGLVSKKSDIDDVIKAVQAASEGQVFISSPIAHCITQATSLLSAKEFQVLELIVSGLNNNQIAQKLHRSSSTINTHRVSLMQKLEVHSVVELIHFAQKNGLYQE